jgi:hypothetical protein
MKCETKPWALGLLAGLLVLLFGLFEALDYQPLFGADHEAPLGHKKHTTSERQRGTTAADVMRAQLVAISCMQEDYPAAEPSVWFYPCGDENSFYYPGLDTVVLCAEMAEHPGAAIQFALHEMGHAVTTKYQDIGDENAADEMAILAMVRWGYLDEMLDAAMYMLDNWPHEHVPGDEHPGGAYRAWELICAESAAEARIDPRRPTTPECRSLLDGLEVKWDRRIPRQPKKQPRTK